MRSGALTAALIFGAGIALLIVAASTGYYYRLDYNGSVHGIGPFRSCVNGESDANCMDTGLCRPQANFITEGCAQFDAMRGLLVVSMMVGIVTFVLMIVYTFKSYTTATFRFVTTALGIFSAVLAAISMCTGIDWKTNYLGGWSYGWGFVLEVAGWVINLIGSIYFLTSAKSVF